MANAQHLAVHKPRVSPKHIMLQAPNQSNCLHELCVLGMKPTVARALNCQDELANTQAACQHIVHC